MLVTHAHSFGQAHLPGAVVHSSALHQVHVCLCSTKQGEVILDNCHQHVDVYSYIDYNSTYIEYLLFMYMTKLLMVNVMSSYNVATGRAATLFNMRTA